MSEELVMDQAIPATPRREPWNKGKLVGQKAPLKVKDIWAIRVLEGKSGHVHIFLRALQQGDGVSPRF